MLDGTKLRQQGSLVTCGKDMGKSLPDRRPRQGKSPEQEGCPARLRRQGNLCHFCGGGGQAGQVREIRKEWSQ